MFYNLSYRLKSKAEFRRYFFDNFHKSEPHHTAGSYSDTWRKIFDLGNGPLMAVVEELNLSGLNVLPYFSFLYQGAGLPLHIDIDRIVGININLMETPAVIRMGSFDFAYECALLDVGAIPHLVPLAKTPRLVLKFSVRAPWSEVLDRVTKFVDPLELASANTYQSLILPENESLVRL